MTIHSAVRLPLLLVLTAAGAALPAGCGTASAPSQVERTDSAGVDIVVNRGADHPLDWNFERVFSLGGADDGPESFFQVSAGSLDTDRAGNLYVLDPGNHRVQVFDSEGRHVRELGRRGGGPGEFQWPTSLKVADDGSLTITDIGHRGLVRIAATGEALEHRPLENWSGGRVETFGEALLVELNAGTREARINEVTRIDEGGSQVLLASEPAPMKPVDLGCVQLSGMPQLFAAPLVWAAGQDRIAAVVGPAYDVQLHDGTRPIARVRRDVQPRPATRALAIQEVGEAFNVSFGGGGGCSAEPDKVVDARGFAEIIPAVRRVAVAPDGTLWVRRFGVKGDPEPIDIFAHSGEYLGTLPAGTPFPDAFFPDGRIATLEKDDMDVQHVVVHRVHEGGEGRAATASR